MDWAPTITFCAANHKRVFLTCYLDDPTYLHGISYSVTSYDLDKFFLLTLQSHPALMAGTGAWSLPFNAAMSKHLYTSYPPYILWLQLSRKTWTCSPAQVLIRSLLLLSNTQKKWFGMIVVRVTLKTSCFPFSLTCCICSCQTVSPLIFGTKSKFTPLHNKGPTTSPTNYCLLAINGCIYRLLQTCVVRDLLTDWALAEHQIPDSQFGFCPTRNTNQFLFILRHILTTAKKEKWRYTLLSWTSLLPTTVFQERSFDLSGHLQKIRLRSIWETSFKPCTQDACLYLLIDGDKVSE